MRPKTSKARLTGTLALILAGSSPAHATEGAVGFWGLEGPAAAQAVRSGAPSPDADLEALQGLLERARTVRGRLYALATGYDEGTFQFRDEDERALADIDAQDLVTLIQELVRGIEEIQLSGGDSTDLARLSVAAELLIFSVTPQERGARSLLTPLPIPPDVDASRTALANTVALDEALGTLAVTLGRAEATEEALVAHDAAPDKPLVQHRPGDTGARPAAHDTLSAYEEVVAARAVLGWVAAGEITPNHGSRARAEQLEAATRAFVNGLSTMHLVAGEEVQGIGIHAVSTDAASSRRQSYWEDIFGASPAPTPSPALASAPTATPSTVSSGGTQGSVAPAPSGGTSSGTAAVDELIWMAEQLPREQGNSRRELLLSGLERVEGVNGTDLARLASLFPSDYPNSKAEILGVALERLEGPLTADQLAAAAATFGSGHSGKTRDLILKALPRVTDLDEAGLARLVTVIPDQSATSMSKVAVAGVETLDHPLSTDGLLEIARPISEINGNQAREVLLATVPKVEGLDGDGLARLVGVFPSDYPSSMTELSLLGFEHLDAPLETAELVRVVANISPDQGRKRGDVVKAGLLRIVHLDAPGLAELLGTLPEDYAATKEEVATLGLEHLDTPLTPDGLVLITGAMAKNAPERITNLVLVGIEQLDALSVASSLALVDQLPADWPGARRSLIDAGMRKVQGPLTVSQLAAIGKRFTDATKRRDVIEAYLPRVSLSRAQELRPLLDLFPADYASTRASILEIGLRNLRSSTGGR